MNKKAILWSIAAILIIAVGIGLYLWLTASEPIPVLSEYAISYGDSPADLEEVGTALEVTHNISDTRASAYVFQLKVLGFPAQMTCFFHENEELTQVELEWTLENVQAAQTLAAKVQKLLVDAYAGEEDYFFRKMEEYTALGRDDGATGMFYQIRVKENTVFVSCINLE